ncbi:hypothetical protein [Blastopirellula retiformator]|uniref:Helix-turn-helix domain protein n=1 Tax=Blastopirellula retiformator TaxID=2527970 RepID=A0A5C5V6P4_9BACT|nr:hypothetical protein [Blastopirellula retiformator]TWT33382.1 hypothetical protein Enr8_32090 [Blastopirellula retiformator]
MDFREPIDVNRAAEIIGCKSNYVRVLFDAGRLDGKKLTDRAILIERQSAIAHAKDFAKSAGRPRSAKPNTRLRATLPPLKDPIGTPEAAEILGCSVDNVCKMLQAGRMIGYKLSLQGWAIERREVLKHVPAEVVGRPRGGTPRAFF